MSEIDKLKSKITKDMTVQEIYEVIDLAYSLGLVDGSQTVWETIEQQSSNL